MTAREVIEVAKREIGYIGKKSNKDLDIPDANITGKYTKYARDLNEAGYYNGNKNGYSWCCVFVDWCFWIAAGRDKDKANEVKPVSTLGAGVKWEHRYLNDKGMISDTPIVGAQVFYSDDTSAFAHTGLVAKVTEDSIETIEGNWGNSVTSRIVKRNDKRIVGYGIPRYEPEDDEEPKGDSHLHRIAELFAELTKEFEEWANE